MTHKVASSQAAWALLTEGVTKARVEAHRVQHLVNRALSLVSASEKREHLYQVAGDIIVGLPPRLDQVLLALDRTGLALSKMGEEFLKSRLPLGDKMMVEEAVESAFGGAQIRHSARRLATRYLQANDAAALEYAQRMKEGPVTEEQINGHRNLIEAYKDLTQAIQNFQRALPPKLSEIFFDYTGQYSDLAKFLTTIMVPMGFVAEPQTRKPILKRKV